MPQISGSKYMVMAGWDDVPHIGEDEKRELLEGTPVYLRKARSQGIPTLGDGAVFPFPEEFITVEPFALPPHWARINGMDFGWTHPNAVAFLAFDADNDTVYLVDGIKQSQTLIPVIASSVKARGDWIPVAWPHDGHQVKDAKEGQQVAEQYRDEGVNMLSEHATFERVRADELKSSIVSVEAGIQEMLTRMQTGRFKVFSSVPLFFEEYRIYHRKDGAIVKLVDDLISATRYGIMMLRFAKVKPVVIKRDESVRGRRSNWRVG